MNQDQALKVIKVLEFLSSSSESDDEEELLSHLARHEISRIHNFVDNVVHRYSDRDFQRNFRLRRSTVGWLIAKFEDSAFFPKNLSHGGRNPITAETHILSFLWFAGNKCALRDVSERFGICISALFTAVNRVMDFFIDMAPNVIKMPVTAAELNENAAEFNKISGFPNIIGCIDGTSIHIRIPKHKIKSTYTNRHDMPSITLQGICDYKRRFIDVSTGAPGKVHDSRVFKISYISSKLKNICGDRYHILGDNAYPIRTYLLTPYKDFGNLTHRHINYNKKLSACRVLIENTFGILKGRFRQLQQIDMHTVTKITKFIVVCCVLHNLCIDHDDLYEFDELVNEHQLPEDEQPDTDVQLRRRGEEKRDAIKNSLEYL